MSLFLTIIVDSRVSKHLPFPTCTTVPLLLLLLSSLLPLLLILLSLSSLPITLIYIFIYFYETEYYKFLSPKLALYKLHSFLLLCLTYDLYIRGDEFYVVICLSIYLSIYLSNRYVYPLPNWMILRYISLLPNFTSHLIIILCNMTVILC